MEPPDTEPAPTTVWISSMKRIALVLLLQLPDDLLEPLLEIAAELRAGQERAHVQRVDAIAAERLGHLAVHDHLGEPLGDGRLADARLADVDGVVLQPAAEHLDGALEDLLAADERVDAAGARLFREIHRVCLQAAARRGPFPAARRSPAPRPR